MQTAPRLLLSASLLALLAGCNVGPDYAAPKFEVPESFVGADNAPTPEAPATDAKELAAWWHQLNDQTLTGLIDSALVANHDVRLAVARLDEARALLGVAESDKYPRVDADASYNRSRGSETTTNGSRFVSDEDDNYRVGMSASWELDFFGRVRRSVEAARAELDGAEASVADAQVVIAAEVARLYVELRGAQRRLDVNLQAITVRQQTLELAQTLVKAGLSADLDVAQAQAELATRKAQTPQLEGVIRRNANAIAVLLNKSTAEVLPLIREASPLPVPPETLATGAPAELLMRRPDLRQAERALAAATARIGVATADLYPRFTLGGNLAFEAANPGDIYDLDSRSYGFGPSMTWSVFNAGRVRSNIDAADARTRQALLSYERAVRVAIRETEDAMVGWAKERARLTMLRDAVTADRRAVDLADALVKSGLSSLTPVLDNQRRLYEAEDELVLSEIAVTQNAILVYRSLGGGWTPPELRGDAKAETDETDVTSPKP